MSANYRHVKHGLGSDTKNVYHKGLKQQFMLGLFILIVIMFISAKAVIVKAEYNHEKVYQKMYTTVLVESGDTVWKIAEEKISAGYENISELVEEIGFINGLDGNYFIRSGSVIIVPYYGEV